MTCYDVALWHTWKAWAASFPETVASVEAESPAASVIALMQLLGLRRVVKAAAGPDGLIRRWEYVEAPVQEEVME